MINIYKNRKLAKIIVVSMLFIIVLTLPGHALTNTNFVSKGLHLRYNIVSLMQKYSTENTFVSSLCIQKFEELGLKPGKLFFEIDLMPLEPGNYTMQGSEISIQASGPPPAWACASADEATLTVDVLGEEDGRTAIRLTLTFKNLTVATNKLNEPLFKALLHSPLSGGAWKLDTYTVTRTILVDGATGEAVDKDTGRGLGEWPLWLPRSELESKLSLILASINYQLPFYYKEGAGFAATLLLLNASETNGDYTFTLNGKPATVKAADTAVAHSLPFTIVYQQVPRAPPPSVQKLLARYGCAVRQTQARVEVACDELLHAYKAGRKPWGIRLSTIEYRGAPMKQLEITYRGLTLTPNPVETYRAVYWRSTGLLLYIEEDPTVYGATPGFFPPPASNYILWNNTALVFRSLKAPITLKLTSARTPTTSTGHRADTLLWAAAAALLIPALIALGKPLKRWTRRAASLHASPTRPSD